MRGVFGWIAALLAVVVAVLIAGRWVARAPRAERAHAEQASPDAAREGEPPAASSAPGPAATAPARLAATDPHPLPELLIDPAVLVEKSTRTLTVFSDGSAVKRYRIALGADPVADKEREGDMRTPLGEFYVCSKNAASKYHRALALSYPNEEDADRGLAEGLINKREHRTILTAIHHMQRPPYKTALGGEIMLHGGGSDRGDWTQGCVALDDADAAELFDGLPLGTPVEIVP